MAHTSTSMPDHRRLEIFVTTAAGASVAGLAITWIVLLWFWIAGSSDSLAWKGSLAVLAVLTLWNILVVLAGWLTALRLLIAPLLAPFIGIARLALLPPSIAAVLLRLPALLG